MVSLVNKRNEWWVGVRLTPRIIRIALDISVEQPFHMAIVLQLHLLMEGFRARNYFSNRSFQKLVLSHRTIYWRSPHLLFPSNLVTRYHQFKRGRLHASILVEVSFLLCEDVRFPLKCWVEWAEEADPVLPNLQHFRFNLLRVEEQALTGHFDLPLRKFLWRHNGSFTRVHFLFIWTLYQKYILFKTLSSKI